MKKTIVFSDNSLWGCLNFRGYIINKFIEQGYQVVVVAPNESFVKVDIPANIIYESIKMERTGYNPIKDIVYMLHLHRIYRHYRPNIIFHYTIKPNIYGTFAAKMIGIPSVTMVTGLGYVFANRGIINDLIKKIYKIALGCSSYVMFLNKDNYNLMLNHKMVRTSNSILLKGGEGIEVSKFSLMSIDNETKPVFLMVARVLYDKGYAEFVEAARSNPTARFQLIGALDINPRAVPADIINNENSIEYLGFMPREQVFEYIKKCSCIVLPSYHEGMSITLVEAIAMGKPVICTDIAGCRETVEHGKNGYLVPLRDGKALSLACKKFISLSSAQKEKMAYYSRKKAELQFDVEKVWKIYRDIINEII